MTAILRQLGIDRMTVGERIALVQEILDSVSAEQPRASLSEAKCQELARRLADETANPDGGVPLGRGRGGGPGTVCPMNLPVSLRPTAKAEFDVPRSFRLAGSFLSP